eukprot:GHVH01007181.1.p1 GENE.GHVH01007181.1~~GHVH01007181.1.p1  ORF type:complete len:149 (+),score=28.11 GHVH01007181.1:163-609(+)
MNSLICVAVLSLISSPCVRAAQFNPNNMEHNLTALGLKTAKEIREEKQRNGELAGDLNALVELEQPGMRESQESMSQQLNAMFKAGIIEENAEHASTTTAVAPVRRLNLFDTPAADNADHVNKFMKSLHLTTSAPVESRRLRKVQGGK